MNTYSLIPLLLLLQITLQTMADTLPDTEPFPGELTTQLSNALAIKGPDYVPRTHHLLESGQPRYINRLILEDSPYLLQHAHNPVNWYAWGDEAFARAKEDNKPIFLSIGYSTCHWCHVMERESFEDTDIAGFLNKNFISIKVDREQRPDVDEAYMTSVLIINGQGGWPMSNFMTPAGNPFYGGTYYPPASFMELIHRIHDAWINNQDTVIDQARELTALVENVIHQNEAVKSLGIEVIGQTASLLVDNIDHHAGGFGGSPKFPNEPILLFLLQYAERNNDVNILSAVEHTLQMMAQGGIYDQIGGGFHRYATDSQWLVPHFEKMLYNQAHLSQSYLLAFRITGKEIYARTAREILDYVFREMTAPDGGFYSATDADSEGQEGKYFVWTIDELRNVLSDEDTELVIKLYGVSESGNFEGKNILYLPISLSDFAEKQNFLIEPFLRQLDTIREKLLQARNKRIPPLRDDKIIVAWNSMMIYAYVMAAEILNDKDYLDIAIKAGQFLWQHQWNDGKLSRVYLNNHNNITARQDDYAYLAQAFIALYDCTSNRIWLEQAQQIINTMLNQHWDDKAGGFLMSNQKSTLFVQPKDLRDSATPSGNAIAARALTRLYIRTGDQEYRNKATQTINMTSNLIHSNPSSSLTMLAVLDEITHGELGSHQYGAHGVVKATADIKVTDDNIRVSIKLDIGENWHVNSNKPKLKDIVPTDITLDDDVSGWEIQMTHYPDPVSLDFNFSDVPLDVYIDTVRFETILIQKNSETTNIIPLKLTFQACDNQSCLAPETLVFRLGL